MSKYKVFKTKENSILIIKVEYENLYWSITASEIEPITVEDGEERAREMLENGELWKMAVEADQTEQSLTDWIDLVLSTDGFEHILDCSLYPEQHEINNTNYAYRSGSCGCLHEEIVKLWPEADVFVKAHLKTKSQPAQKAFDLLKSDDVDKKVIELTKEIIV